MADIYEAIPPVTLEIPSGMSIEWHLGEIKQMLYSQYSAEHYIIQDLMTRMDNLTEVFTLSQFWLIGLGAFQAAVLLFIILSTIWSRAT